MFPPQDDYTPVSNSMHKNDKLSMLHFDTSGSTLVEGETSEMSVSMSLLTEEKRVPSKSHKRRC